MPDGMEMGMQMDMGQAAPQEQPYGGPGMQAPPLPSPMQQGIGGGAAPIPQGMGEASQQAYGRYIAEHGQEAVVQLQQLDRAAKFRRALSMIQETFATITGREDIAARVRQQIVQEDHQRAAQVETQILARVGAQQIHEEQRATAAKQQEDKSKAAEATAKEARGAREKATDNTRLEINDYLPDKDGVPPDQVALANAHFERTFNDNSKPLAEYELRWARDPAAVARKNKLAEEKALGPTRAAQAGDQAGAAARERLKVEDSDAANTRAATRAGMIRQAQLERENDPKNRAAAVTRIEEDAGARERGATAVDEKFVDKTIASAKDEDTPRATRAKILVEGFAAAKKAKAPAGDLLRLKQEALTLREKLIQELLSVDPETERDLYDQTLKAIKLIPPEK